MGEEKQQFDKKTSIKIIFFCSFISWTFLLLLSAANAQEIPNLPRIEPPQPPPPETLPSLPEIISPTEDSSDRIRLAPDRIPGTIVVKKFEIFGDRVLGSEIIDATVAPYLFRPLSFIELLEVQNKITQLYIDRGYITTGAFIPPQTIENRTIKIEIIEGKIAEIKISGLKHLKPQYIRRRLKIATQPPLNQDKLLNALQLLQIDPLIADISVELSTGIEPGTSFLNINIKEADAFAIGINLDNSRPPSLGTFRRQIELDNGNLLGWGDRFNVAYSNSDGANSLENLSYTVPINAYDTELKLTHSRSDSEIINGEFRELDIDIRSRLYAIDIRQPLWQTPTRNIAIGAGFSQQNSATTLRDIPLRLSRGATIDGKTNVSALHFWQEYSDRDRQQAFVSRSQFSLGIDAFNSNIDNEPDSKFLVWRGQAQYLRLLNSNINLLLKSDLQLANDGLLSIEQFNAGGGNTVRGYPQDSILGDNGLLFSAEFRSTIVRFAEENTSLELIPFFDFARVWNSDNFKLEENTLYSVGLGLQLLIEDDLTARIDWGIPLTDIESTGSSLSEQGWHFSFNLNLL